VGNLGVTATVAIGTRVGTVVDKGSAGDGSDN
jgi:hypothetical protein